MANLSIVIPTFRPECFEALQATMADNVDTDAEWIVVDDGSGLEYDRIFHTLPKDVTVIRQRENRRQGAARNVGLRAASAPYIKFLDADDRLDKGHLVALLNATKTLSGKAIPFAPTRHVFTNGTTSTNDSWQSLEPDADAQLDRMLVWPFMHHCGALFPRDLILRLNGYDESLITDEDGDLLIRVLREGYHFVPVPNVQYYYIHSTGGPRVSADDDIAKLKARIKVCDKIEAGFESTLPAATRTALAQRMDKIAMTYWPTFPEEARALVARAKALCPDYQPAMRTPLRVLRYIGGPSLVFAVARAYRAVRGRPSGGSQG